jgi:photosystem II stability/assembly factor-like uncharacterized protein
MHPDHRPRPAAAVPQRALRAAKSSAAWMATAALVTAGCSSGTTSPKPPPPPPPPLSSLVVTPKQDTLLVGQTHVFTVTAMDTLGALVGDASYTWGSTAPTVANVSQVGQVTGISEGAATIRVSGGGKADSAAVAVIVKRGWYTQQSNLSVDLNAVYFLPDRRTGWAVGSSGRIIATTDAGATWTAQISNSAYNLNGVWFTDANNGWAVGATGAVLQTFDGGATWTRIISNASENLTDVWFASRDTGWVVGANGVVLRTFDRGVTWNRVTPTAFDLESVAFAGTTDGWAVGAAGIILGTHDRGLSWYIVQPAVTAQALKAVWRRSNLQAWAAGASGTALRTITTVDSLAWELDNAGANNQLAGVCYPTDEIGYVVGYNSGGVGIVLRTDDGGVSWQSQSPNTQFRLKDVFFVDALNGWAVGRNGTIIHTSTGGLP